MDAANEELNQRGLAPFGPDETRRNIVIEGIDVYALLGQEFCIGAVRLRGSDPTRPCHVPSAAAGKAGFAEAYHNRGGILAEVLTDGLISIGDILVTETLQS
ncbi:MAG: MOSC domain-containing protein [Xanthobacteraceae bacterium]|nr:MOSC domain-containing protein [Xanthobacteraceae bacterium]